MIATDEGSKYVDEFLKATMTIEEKKSYTPLMFYGTSFIEWIKQKNTLKTLSIDHPDFPIIYYELGCICHKKEQCSEALAIYCVC